MENPPYAPSGVMAALVVTIKVTALAIAVCVGLVLSYQFAARWYVAVVGGVAAYIVAKVTVATAIGYVWGRQDARELKRAMAATAAAARERFSMPPS
jgi:hypothetical protein